MGRRSFISATTINRIMSASRARKREAERIDLINSQSGTAKEMPPTYSLLNVDFNSETRATKIEILQSQNYRTIERYVTQNYVKYPIFSQWKTRTKSIKKSIKLTNQELENLNMHSEPLIKLFAEEIIAEIGNEDLFPSWFIRSCLENEYAEKVRNWENEKSEFKDKIYNQIKAHRARINELELRINEHNEILNKKLLKRDKLNVKIQRIDSAPKSIIKSIFTLSIYNYLISERRKQKLLSKKNGLDKQIKDLENSIHQKEVKISELENDIKVLRDNYSNKETEIDNFKNIEYLILSEKLEEIQSLPCDVLVDNEFMPLKRFIGLEYVKIVGCYIIHNKLNDRFYVGQSKDVLKRLRQHFKGTTPSNVIFAEDYYATPVENREDLFEVKIIPLQTKDELDFNEKTLIEKYDAFTKGYNGTNGNS